MPRPIVSEMKHRLKSPEAKLNLALQLKEIYPLSILKHILIPARSNSLHKRLSTCVPVCPPMTLNK